MRISCYLFLEAFCSTSQLSNMIQVSEELVNVTSVIVVAAQGGRRLAALGASVAWQEWLTKDTRSVMNSINFFDPGELLVEYTVLQPEGSEEETSEHVEDLMEKAGCMSIDFEYLLDLGRFDIFVRYASKILKSRVLRSSSITVSRFWVITLYQCCFFYT